MTASGAILINQTDFPSISETIDALYRSGSNENAYLTVLAALSKKLNDRLNQTFNLKGYVFNAYAGNNVTTRTPVLTFEGSTFPIPVDIEFSKAYLYASTGNTGAGIKIAIYQSDDGNPYGPLKLKCKKDFIFPTSTAQIMEYDFGETVVLKKGYAFILHGRSNATGGVSLRVWTISAREPLNRNVPTGEAPLTFTTAFNSTLDAPSQIEISNLVATVTNVAVLGRFALCLLITHT